MAVTGHWIREDKPELVSTTLGCVEFPGSHTSERLAEKVIDVMETYGIQDTAVALTTDTAANIKKAGKKLLRPEWHACSCHVLQLCANKILNEPSVKATFAKHNRLTGHPQSSASSMDKLKTLQEVRYGPVKKFPTHCATRWNSNYEQGRVILDYKFCVQQLCDTLSSEGKLNITYTEADWTNTSAVVELLRLFCEATEIMQGDSFITNSMMPMLATSLHVFCVTKASDMELPEHIRDVADAMFLDVEDRFYPPTDCAMIAAVCDPRTKKLQCTSAAAPSDTPATAAFDEPAASPPHSDLRKKKTVDKSSLLFSKLLAVSTVVADDDTPPVDPQSPEAILAERKRAAAYELERYLDAKTLAATTSSQAVLDWWFAHRQVYPVLFKIACVYLAVPASSGSSERVFSTAGNIVTKKRNRLCPE
ncbi:unnamed protein product, partial [Ectocarpus fasciculatus]